MKNIANIVVIAVSLLAAATAFAQAQPSASENCAQQTRIAQPTPAERMQMCELAQREAIKRIAEIKRVPASQGAKYLNEVIENQRTQQQLITMQTHIAEGACAVAFGEPTPTTP